MTKWLCGGRGPAGGRDEVDAVGTRVAGLSNPSRYRESGCVERRSHRRARYGIVEHAGRTVDARAQLTVEVVVEERPGAEDQRIHRRGDGQQPRRLPRHKANYKSSLYKEQTEEQIKALPLTGYSRDFLATRTPTRLGGMDP